MTRNNFLKRLGLMAIAAVVAPFVPKPKHFPSFTVKDAVREYQEGHLYLDCDAGKWYLLRNGKWKAI